MMRITATPILFSLAAGFFLFGAIPSVRADITATSGTASVSPENPSSWTSSTTGYIGYSADGTVAVNGGVLTAYGLSKSGGTTSFGFGGGTMNVGSNTFTSNVPMTLTAIGGNATVNATGQYPSFSGALSGSGGLTKTGSGTLTLSAANNYEGTTVLASGTLMLVGSLSLPRAWNPVLSLGGVDLQTGQIIFAYDSGDDPAAMIRDLLAASYDEGRWDQGQFRLSAASKDLTLGWIDDTVSRQVIIMATLPGDFNLDGVVDSTDLAIWTAGVGIGTTWAQGDANYDGVVNDRDHEIMMAHYVPEPGTLVLLIVCLVGTLAHIGLTRRGRSSKNCLAE